MGAALHSDSNSAFASIGGAVKNVSALPYADRPAPSRLQGISRECTESAAAKVLPMMGHEDDAGTTGPGDELLASAAGSARIVKVAKPNDRSSSPQAVRDTLSVHSGSVRPASIGTAGGTKVLQETREAQAAGGAADPDGRHEQRRGAVAPPTARATTEGRPELAAAELAMRDALAKAAASKEGSADADLGEASARFARGATCTGVLKLHTPTGDVNLTVTYDTASEVDAVSSEMAAEMLRKKCSWGKEGGSLSMANNTTVQPIGAVRALFTATTKKNAGLQSKTARNDGYSLPTDVTFCTDLKIVQDLTSEVIIGWPTLCGTGLLAVVFGITDFEPMEGTDEATELEGLWHDEEYKIEMPSIAGTADEQRQLRDLLAEFRHLFDEPVKGGSSKLPPMDIELKKNPDGSDMQPRPARPRHVSPFVQELIEKDIDMRLGKGWYRRPEPTEVCPYASSSTACSKTTQQGPRCKAHLR